MNWKIFVAAFSVAIALLFTSNSLLPVHAQGGILSATTGLIGGGARTYNCVSATTSVTGATNTMAVVATPATFPGAGFYWYGYVSSSNTVTVSVCPVGYAAPAASVYNVRVIQ